MILGIGVDLVNISRIKIAVEKWGDRFLKRIFTEGEKEYCLKYKDPYPGLAARFAVKEAVIKAFKFAEVKKNYFKEISVINIPGGAPEVFLSGDIQVLAHEKGVDKIHLSISHDTGYAVAQVIFEGLE